MALKPESHPRSRYAYSKGYICTSCYTPVTNRCGEIGKGMCQPCYGESRRGKPYGTGRNLTAQGYIVLTGKYGHPNEQSGRGLVLEHVFVMSEYLGRGLLPYENVHHKNEDRTDNRLENLELWSTSQPPGQRVQDKLQWAREIIALYDGQGEIS